MEDKLIRSISKQSSTNTNNTSRTISTNKLSFKSTMKVSLKKYDLNALEMKFATLSDNQKNSPDVLEILTPSMSAESNEETNPNDSKNSTTELCDISQKLPHDATPSKQRKRNSTNKSTNLLRQIKSDFSPKFLEIKHIDNGPTSRFGRELKLTEHRDIFSKKRRESEQYNPHLIMTPPPSSPPIKTQIFVSPIDKLINKNKLLAAKNTQNLANFEHRMHVSKVIDFDSSISETDTNYSDYIDTSSSSDLKQSISLPINLNNSNEDIVKSIDSHSSINIPIQTNNSSFKKGIAKYLINNNNMPIKRKNGIKKISKIPYKKDIQFSTHKNCVDLIKENSVENLSNDSFIETIQNKSNRKILTTKEDKIRNNNKSSIIKMSERKEQQKYQSIYKNIINDIDSDEDHSSTELQILPNASKTNTFNENIDIETQISTNLVMKSPMNLKNFNTKNLVPSHTENVIKDKLLTSEVVGMSKIVETKENHISTNDNDNLPTEMSGQLSKNISDELSKNLLEPSYDEKINEIEGENIGRGIPKNETVVSNSAMEVVPSKNITTIQKNFVYVTKSLSNIKPIIVENEDFVPIRETVVDNNSSVVLEKDFVSSINGTVSTPKIPVSKENKPNIPIIPSTSNKTKRKRANSIYTEISTYVKISEYCRIGELVWARVGRFPYWPAMIFPDENNQFDMKDKEKVHVRFFADRGRRSWIPYKCVFQFSDLNNFEKYKKEFSFQITEKVARSMFTPSSNSKPMWYEAISEAEFMKTHNIEDRKRLFDEMVENQLNLIKDKASTKRKSSIKNKDVTFHQLFNGSDAHTETSTPITSSSLSINKINENLIPKSPTPDSPAFEPLTPSSDTNTQINSNESVIVQPKETTSNTSKLPLLPSSSNEEFDEILSKMKNITFNTNKKSNEEFLKILINGFEMLQYNKLKDLTTLKAEFCGKFFAEKRIVNMKKKLSEEQKIEQQKQQDVLKKQKEAERIRKVAERAQRLAETIKKDEEVYKSYIIQCHPRNILLKGLHRENVCKICTYPGNILKCNGHCNEYLHRQCPDINNDVSSGRNSKASTISRLSSDTKESSPSMYSEKSHITGEDILLPAISTNDQLPIVCEECSQNPNPKCFVCNENDSLDHLLKCTEKSCFRKYHLGCLTYWPQSKIASEKTLLCPCHICHTCISDDPREKHYKIEQSKLLRCIRCPATYHTDSCCIPAGTEILTATQIICPRHREPKKLPVSANWCFLCAQGGKLICCESCPGTFHVECLNIAMPDKYICEECETGRMPLYGEIVWSKIGSFRWWPSIIVPPFLVPDTVELSTHYQHDFCIRFFGSNNYSWATRGQVFLYQEGDSNSSSINSRVTNDVIYNVGLEKSAELFQYAKQIKANYMNLNNIDKILKPFPYVKLKTNRPVPPVRLNEETEDLSICECKITDEDPCGPQSNCLNRIVFTECSPKLCPVGDLCQNQHIQKGINANVIERRVNGKGWGLITLENIKKESFVIEYVGELINHKEFQKRLIKKQAAKDENFYFFTMSANLVIDAGPKGNLARFISHSCQPNLETQMWHVNGNDRVGLFAIKDIPANTELTFDYNWTDFGGKKICLCGSAKCSGFIGQKYIDPHATVTAKKLKISKNKKRGRKRTIKAKVLANTQIPEALPPQSNSQEMQQENLLINNLSSSFDDQPSKKRIKLG